MTVRHTEDGIGWGGLVPSKEERRSKRLANKLVFGGYDGISTLKIAEAIVEDAHTNNQIAEFRRICEYVLELTENDVEPADCNQDVRGI